MRRLWLLVLAIVAGAVRSWVGFWYRVAEAVERRLAAAQDAARDGQEAARDGQEAAETWQGAAETREGAPGRDDGPPAQWLARARRDEPPAHWAAYVRSRAPGLTFPHYRAPTGPPPYPQGEGERARSSGDFPNRDGPLAPPAGERGRSGRRRAEVPAAPAGPRPASGEPQGAGREERSAPPLIGVPEAPTRPRRRAWSPLEWARAVIEPRRASRPRPRPEEGQGDREGRFAPGMPGEALAPERRPGEPNLERIPPVPGGVVFHPGKWPALPGEEAFVRGEGGTDQPLALLDAAGQRDTDVEAEDGPPETAPAPDARDGADHIPQQRGRTARPEPVRDLAARRWPELPEAGDWAADPPRSAESVEDAMRAWRRHRRLDEEQKGVLWNESLY